MRKQITAFILALVLALSLVPAALADFAGIARASTQNVDVDGAKIEFQMYALVDANGGLTNYVKLRDVAHVLNSTPAKFSVGYDGAISIVTGESYTDNGSEMTTPFSGDRAYRPGPGTVKVNGADVKLDAIVLTDDNGGAYTYFKLRDLGAALGFKVDWTGERGVFIETGAAAAPSPATAPAANTSELTLNDFQGVWRRETSDGTIMEYIITGNQFEDVAYNTSGAPNEYGYGPYWYKCGTLTLNKDIYSSYAKTTFPYVLDEYRTKIYSGDSAVYDGNIVKELRTYSFSLTEVNIEAGYFLDRNGFRYDRVEGSQYRDAAKAAMEGNVADDNKAAQAAKGSVYDFLASYVLENIRGNGDSTTTRRSVSIPNNTLTNNDWRFILDYDNATRELFLRAVFSKLSTSGKTNFLNSSTYELTLSADGGPYQGTYSGHYHVSRPNTLLEDNSSATFTINPAAFSMQTERLSMRGDFSDADDTNGAVIMQGLLRALNKEILQPNGYTLADLGFTNFS